MATNLVSNSNKNTLFFTHLARKIPDFLVGRIVVEEQGSMIIGIEFGAAAVQACSAFVQQHLQQQRNIKKSL